MTRTYTPWGMWDPAPLTEVVALFSGAGVRWWVAGGLAIELAVGRTLRKHGDIDILMLRDDHLAVQRVLPTWQWWAADPPGRLRPWGRGEVLPVGVHDIWCRPGREQPWRIQVMLDESESQDWVSRRDARVRRPIATLGLTSADGIPYLAPEVQLFYKAKAVRARDEVDFAAVLPLLTDEQRHWLGRAVTLAYGPHPWSDRLAR
jgi:hypothetical protein